LRSINALLTVVGVLFMMFLLILLDSRPTSVLASILATTMIAKRSQRRLCNSGGRPAVN